MIDTIFHKFSSFTQANVVIAIGLILFLNCFSIVKGLNFILVVISVALMWYGFTQAGYDKKLKKIFGIK